MDICPSCVEDRLMKNISKKNRQVISILSLVFIQFIIICVWSVSK